jgi:hypothetical protein
MGLEKLTIHVESGEKITALFNPNKLVLNRAVLWEEQGAKERDVPELQYKRAQPRTFNLELMFDTYDTPDAEKKDVRKVYTDKLLKLTLVNSELHRPPVCKLFWGKFGKIFQGVLEKLDQQFTLFMEDGTPVRATCTCAFKEWRTNQQDQQEQGTTSSDIAKMRVVKTKDTLSSIAAEEYRDPALWRPIADENGIDDPGNLVPGTVLLVPTLTLRNSSVRK